MISDPAVRAEKARQLRYKKPALASIGFDAMFNELFDIMEECSDVQYFVEDEETLLRALGDDEEAAWEFRMSFTALSAKAEELYNLLLEENVQQDYDDCTVALIGNRYRTLGFDFEEEDYFALCRYETDLAYSEAGKRLMRHTKAEMISIFGQCLGALVAFLDLRQQHDFLKATIDILRGDNGALLKLIKEIDEAYEEADAEDFRPWSPATKRFDHLTAQLPDRMWVE